MQSSSNSPWLSKWIEVQSPAYSPQSAKALAVIESKAGWRILFFLLFFSFCNLLSNIYPSKNKTNKRTKSKLENDILNQWQINWQHKYTWEYADKAKRGKSFTISYHVQERKLHWPQVKPLVLPDTLRLKAAWNGRLSRSHNPSQGHAYSLCRNRRISKRQIAFSFKRSMLRGGGKEAPLPLTFFNETMYWIYGTVHMVNNSKCSIIAKLFE